MNIVIYTKTNCPNCVSAKALLKSKGLEYSEISLDSDSLRRTFEMKFPDIRQMPQIFINQQRVGGLEGLQAALKQVNL